MSTPAESDALAASKGHNTALRAVHGTAMSALLAGLVALDWHVGERVIFAATLAAVVAVGLIEFYRLSERAGAQPLTVFGVACGVLLVGAQWLRWSAADRPAIRIVDPVILMGTLALLGAVAAHVMRRGVEGAWINIGATVLGLAFVWFLASFLWGVREFGVGPLAMFVATVKLSDVGAYFIGRAVGGPKLAPTVSPNKTVSGAVGAVAAGVVAAVAFRLLLPDHSGGFSLAAAAVFGVVVTVFGMLGDLGESVLKRSASVKDAGGLVPGFGGMLDVVDSLLGAAPVAFLLFAWGAA